MHMAFPALAMGQVSGSMGLRRISMYKYLPDALYQLLRLCAILIHILCRPSTSYRFGSSKPPKSACHNMKVQSFIYIVMYKMIDASISHSDHPNFAQLNITTNLNWV